MARAEQVVISCTFTEGFEFTLESRALSWSQALDTIICRDFEELGKEFIVAPSKMGIKHNARSL